MQSRGRKPNRSWAVAAAVPIVIGVFATIAYRFHFPGPITTEADKWGAFGDFFGGVLNPIVGVITLVLLVKTLLSQQEAIQLQSEELALQRRELQLQRAETARSTAALDAQHEAIVRQSFEQTFFAWLQSYRRLIEELHSPTGPVSGSRRLIQLAGQCSGNSACNTDLASGGRGADSSPLTTYLEAVRLYLTDNEPKLLASRFARAVIAYEGVYRSAHSEIGPLFRTLYRLIEWVDGSELSTAQKWHYVAIARAQLSWPEMYLLALNGCTKMGENFVPLAEKYALFDNLEPHTDGLVLAMRVAFTERAPVGFPYSSCAFHSTPAKFKLGISVAKDL